VKLRPDEGLTVLMMFGYSFLAMTAYNIVQPIVRSRFITALGSENMPYVLLVSVFIVGVIMQGYSRLGSLLPGRWVIPFTQLLMVGLLVAFWVLAGLDNQWVEVAFYLFGQIYAVLLISQFWTLANLIYDARAAKRLFGFIGAGSSLGGIMGGAITTFAVDFVGNRNLLLVSAAILALCAGLVIGILGRVRGVELAGIEDAGREKGVGWFEALRMLRESRHLQITAVVIAFTSIGAGFIDQQLNMAIELFKGRAATDSMTSALGQVQVYTSAIGFVIQLFLTSRIHRFLGVGFALMILPISLGGTATLILLNAVLWTPMFARVVDKSIRYTVDKTTREVLFLPLSADVKQKAKPFVDVTLDRVGRAASAFLLLVLIKPWGFGLSGAQWNQISWASLVTMVVWIGIAIVAKRGYVESFRRSLAEQDVVPADVRVPVADLSTIEALIDELGHSDEQRVIYAIDLLDALDRRHLITPLLLHHESPLVRIRVLDVIQRMDADHAPRFDALVERMLSDERLDVRAAAVGALARIREQSARGLMRTYAADADPRVRLSAAAALANSDDAEDLALAETTMEAVAREGDAGARRDLASILERVRNPQFRRIGIALMSDEDADVARRAIATARTCAADDPLFVPPLISLLRSKALKSEARDALVSLGPDAVGILEHVVGDHEEDPAVRVEIPSVLGRIVDPRSTAAATALLEDQDGGVRFAALVALERLHRVESVAIPPAPLEAAALRESNRYFSTLSLRYNLFDAGGGDRSSLLARALDEKLTRTVDRIYRTLALIYPWRDVDAARWAMSHGDARARAGATEYLDNVLTGALRKHILPVLEEMPLDDKVRRGNVFVRSRLRPAAEALAELVHDDDQVIAAAAIQYVEQEQQWQLADDIEYILEHRDARDWYVFEASSWALAGRRLDGTRRRALWLEPLPAIELANRLRRLPLFTFVPVNDLVRLGAAGRQARYEPGRPVAPGDPSSRTLVFLLDGAVKFDGDGDRRVEAPAAFGVSEALQGHPVRATMRSLEISSTLELPYQTFLSLLGDSTPLVRGLFHVAVPEAGADDTPVHRSARLVRPRDAGGAESVMLLEQLDWFAGATTGDLLAVARRSRMMTVEPGTKLLSETDPPALVLLASADATVERPDGSNATTAAKGDVIGVFSALGNRPSPWRAYAATPGSVLRIESADLLQALGERVDLLQRVYARVVGSDLYFSKAANAVSAAPSKNTDLTPQSAIL
jgi:AAA family ATP:ADP antiporter